MSYWYEPNYMSAISFNVWALIIPTFLYLLFRAVKGSQAGLFAVLWIAATYLIWIPISLFTDRVSYIYYFYPTVGAICIGLGLGLSRLIDIWQARKTGKLRWAAISAVTGYLVIHVAVFAIISPLSWISWV
jgi:hypothetical protein